MTIGETGRASRRRSRAYRLAACCLVLAVGLPAAGQTVAVSGAGGTALTFPAGTTSNTVAIATVTLTPSAKVELRELRLANRGTALPGDASDARPIANRLGVDVGALQLWRDANGNGTPDPGDQQLGVAAWDAARRRFAFSGLALELSAPTRLFVTLGAGSGATPGRTLALEVSAADVVLGAGAATGAATGRTVTLADGPTAGNPAASAPMVVLVNPSDAAVLTPPFRVQAQVFDPGGLAGVTVELSTDGGATFPTALSASGRYAPGANGAIFETGAAGLALPPGLYTLRARARDGASTTLSRPVVVSVSTSVRGDGNLLVRDNSSQLCSDCHAVKAHTSAADPKQKYGAWAVACRDCHTPHATPNAYLFAPTVTPPPVTGHAPAREVRFAATTGEAGPSAPPSYANADRSGPCQSCHTRTKSRSGVARWRSTGNADAAHYAAGGPKGTRRCTDCHPHADGFVHGAGGVGCDRCHGHDAGWQGNAKQGGGTFQSHSTHTEDDADDLRGPFVACATCHDTANYPAFRSGVDANGDGFVDLAETDVCDGCHSRGGAYDGVDGAAIGAKALWPTGAYAGAALRPGAERWCVGCHDRGTSVVPAVTGRQAPDVGGDGATTGYYVVGHGARGTECGACHDSGASHVADGRKSYSATADNYVRAYRLAPVNGGPALNVPLEGGHGCNAFQPGNYALCLSCHDARALLADTRSTGIYGCGGNPYRNAPAIETGFRNVHALGTGAMGEDATDVPANIHADHLIDVQSFGSGFWYSDGVVAGSGTTCVTCHDPHGDRRSDGTAAPKMTRGTFGVAVGNTDAAGRFSQMSGTGWSPRCTFACHGNGKWYQDAVPELLSFAVADANPADPAPAEAAFTNGRTVQVTIAASKSPAEMRLAEDAAFTVNATGWLPFAASSTYTLTAGDGWKPVHVKLRNAIGEASGSSGITLDTVAPAATVVVTAPAGGEAWTQGTVATVAWSGATDANLGSWPISLAWSSDGGATFPATFAPAEANDGAYAWTLPVVDTTRARVRLTVTDRAGNQRTATSAGDFTIRPVAPALVSVAAADANPADPSPADAGFTNATAVAVTLAATSYPTQVLLAESADFTQNASGWLPWATSLTYTLSSADGAKTVYAKVRNGAGESGALSTSITLDRTAPALAGAITAPADAASWAPSSAQTVRWDPARVVDANLRPAPLALAYTADGGWTWADLSTAEANDGAFAWTAPATATYRARVRLTATDRAGNRGAVSSGDFRVTTPYLVTTTADSGPGSLRAVLDAVNASPGNATIWFSIPSGALTNGVAAIQLASGLGTIVVPGVVVDAGSQTALVGDTNPNGPEVALLGWSRSSTSDIGLHAYAANAVIRGFQLAGFHHAIHVSGAGGVVQGNHFCFRSGATGGYVAADTNLGVVVDSGAANALVGGPRPEDRNHFAGCLGDSYWKASGVALNYSSSPRVANNLFGLLPNGAAMAGGLARPHVSVGGSDPVLENNQLSGGTYGFYFSGSYRARVRGNVFGLWWDGTSFQPRTPQEYAIALWSVSNMDCVVGGPTVAASDAVLNDSNVVSASATGTGYGIYVAHDASRPTSIQGNFIGTSPSRSQLFPGRVGVMVSAAANGTRVGGTGAGEAGNVITNMALQGVSIASGSSGVKVSGNAIYGNGAGAAGSDDGIFLAAGANADLARPTISAASATQVTVTGVGSADVVEVFESDYDGSGSEYGEGRRLVGTATATGATVVVDVSAAGLTPGRWVTATRSQTLGSARNTSPFSGNVRVQ